MIRSGKLPVDGRASRVVDAMEVVPAPVVYCPFAPRISPYAPQATRYAMGWATRHGFLPTAAAATAFARGRFADLTARAYPEATQPSLCLASCWVTFIVMVDDHLETVLGWQPDRQRRVVDEVVGYLESVPGAGADPGARVPSPALVKTLGRPLAGSLADVWTRTAVLASPAWRHRFAGHMAQYLSANVWEAENRLAERAPQIREYLKMRRYSAATAIFFDLIEVLGAGELPAAALAHPAVTVLLGHAHNAVAWFNDLVSWRKELLRGDQHNLVLVVHRDRRLSLVDAVREVVERHDAEVEAYVAGRARLAAEVAAWPALGRVVDGLAHWIRANVDWSRDSGRYAPGRGDC